MIHSRKVQQAEARPDDALRRRAEADYREMPGLKLTPAQAARLWHLGLSESAQLLESMAAAGLLYRSRDGGYLLLWSR
jgi:hypothetical protein